MEDRKQFRLDPTNAVITGPDGQIIENGVHMRCPHCGKPLLHNHDTVLIHSVGATRKWECCKCRKQYKTLTLPVPPSLTPEQFYAQILQGVFSKEVKHGQENEDPLL